LPSDDIDREQKYLSMLYARLDDMREIAAARRSQVLLEAGGTYQARGEREARAALYTDRIATFDAVEHGLCFGRLEFDGGAIRYVGRIGIFDIDDEYEPLLVDWRAEAARPFYLATAASPQGVRRRRHLRTDGRRVVAVEDEVLDLAEAARAGGAAPHQGLAGEAVLLAAINANRTGQMKDIVETIQADQDRIIRSGPEGILVVQGGPGTGKTAVALHRAAYLLYTYRELLTARGVLIVGPNETFLRYIERVLPSLGETSVLLCTLGDLYPGVRARGVEPDATAELKGSLAMAGVIAAAVRDRQRLPEATLDIPFDHGTVPLEPETCAQARDRARASRLPHNRAREVFAREIVDALAGQMAGRMSEDVRSIGAPDLDPATDPYLNPEIDATEVLSQSDIEDIRQELRADRAVWAAIDELWPVLTPQRLLTELFASAERLDRAAPALAAPARAALRRTGGDWTPADVPLLDEAAELLGADDRAARARRAAQHRDRIAYAQGVLDILSGSSALEAEDEVEVEVLSATDLLAADELAQRHGRSDGRTAAQRAAADRGWAFGHVIVDEAQELSAMAWRMLMRRSPSRSMTLVGDVTQTGDPAGTDSWQRILAPYVDDRWRLAELTVNYRTPAEVMQVAAGVLATIDPHREPPRSVRFTGTAPWRREVAGGGLADRVAEAVAAEVETLGDGRMAVLAPPSRLAEIAAAVARTVPAAAAGPGAPLDRPVVVLTVRQAKGLEFDSVLVAEPQRILTESPRGAGDLYVALTRTTQRLGVLHSGEPPAALADMLLTPASQAAPSRA
jgi:DNA helicase IV